MLFLNLSEAVAFELDHRGLLAARHAIPSLLVAATKEGAISLCRLSPGPGISRLFAPGKVAAIEGHEPGPTEKYHPWLPPAAELCTDISYIERVGDYLVVVHELHETGKRGPDGRAKRRDGLLCFPVGSVLERLGA